MIPHLLLVSSFACTHSDSDSGGNAESEAPDSGDSDDMDTDDGDTDSPMPIARPECTRAEPASDAWPVVMVEQGFSTPGPLPAPMSTPCPEDCPEISPDGSSLYFCWLDDVYVGDDVDWEAFLLSEVNGTYEAVPSGDGWTWPTFVDLGVGQTWSVDMSTSRTPDGQEVFFHSIRDGNIGTIETFSATWQGGAWSEAERLPAVVNDGSSNGEVGITPDGEALIFASTRAGGLGGHDLWISARTDQGWSEPVNLGAPINTAGDEVQAFVRADGAELWYASGGDNPESGIYRVPRTDDSSWGPEAWGAPEWIVTGAVGEPSITEDGSTLYFTHVYLDDGGAILDADIWSADAPAFSSR